MSRSSPNFILFMTDQQRGDCLSIENHPVLLTPIMDSIAGSGTRFARAYSTCPSCIPARRSLLSGQFPATNGMVGYKEATPWHPPGTLPGLLRQAGYQTAIVGRKMHQYRPDTEFGFDYAATEYPAYVEQNQPRGGGGPAAHGISGNGWSARPWHLPEHLHYTHWVLNEALDFLAKRDRSKPFFLVVSFVTPHPPLVPPAFYFDRYLRADLPEPAIGDWAVPPPNGGRGLDVQSDRVHLRGEALRSCQAGYFGLINHVDDQLYRITGPHAHLDGPARSNTVTFVTSDHGEMLGDHYLFRKCYPYEGSARIPLLVSAPRSMGFKSAQVRGEPVCLEDIMPTMLDLAGCAVPDWVDGKSLVPLLRGEADAKWRPHLHGEHATCYRYEQANHYLVDDRWKYIWYVHDGSEQLFDLKEDPQERRNLARTPQHAERLVLWRSRLIERLKDRPEGFTDGQKLIAGRKHDAAMAHASKVW